MKEEEPEVPEPVLLNRIREAGNKINFFERPTPAEICGIRKMLGINDDDELGGKAKNPSGFSAEDEHLFLKKPRDFDENEATRKPGFWKRLWHTFFG